MSLLALDFGTKLIGVAISDKDEIIALPRFALKNEKGVIEKIGKICEEDGISKIILGLPLTADGEESVQTGQAKEFALQLDAIGIPVDFQDERFTTEEARALVRKKYQKTDLDAVAAALILESYLESR